MESILQMAYHPAKKEVQFKRFQNGREIEITERSKLVPYMSRKGNFVLQHYGQDFFNDIADVFDGQKAIEMRVITTKPDFLDFQQMVEHYNKTNTKHVQIHATPGTALSDAEGYLPDMNQVYENVRDYGLQASEILDDLRGQFSDIPQDKEAIKQSVAIFDGDIQQEIERIKEKVDDLGKNDVNLCFAGAYSTGKSALINALLGYRILPESSDSKTARMFRIRSPKTCDEPVSITCKIGESSTRLEWSSDKFKLVDGPTENTSVTKINQKLQKFESKPHKKHEQMCGLLETLNDEAAVGTDIDVVFPIPLDTDNVQFTIFDTPGTDSNYETHQETLVDALSEQSNSILIFVAAPDKMEGAGNRLLFKFINKTKKEGPATIDISRSLFVINKADTVDRKDRESKQKAQITIPKPQQGDKGEADDDVLDEDDALGGDINDTITLSDKKLFFVSAKDAYAAKAKKAGIATSEDSSSFTMARFKCTDEELAEQNRYYKQNKCANSDLTTKHMIAQCDEALAAAETANDEIEMVHISSGLYALEKELVQYGEKYAAAVRAYAMIDGVNKALTNLQKKSSMLQAQNEDTLRKINHGIDELKSTIMQSINKALDKHKLEDDVIPKERAKYLKLDAETFKDVEKKVTKAIDRRLNQLLRNDEKKKEQINNDIDRILREWTKGYVEKRNILLDNVRRDAIKDAREAIEKTGKLDPNAIQEVCNIQPSEVEPKSVSIARLYDTSKMPWDFWWIHMTFVDKKQFKSAVKGELARYQSYRGKEFRKDYADSLNTLLRAIQKEFWKNLDKYSLLMRAMLENRQSVEVLHNQIIAAIAKLTELQESLNNVIWRVQ